MDRFGQLDVQMQSGVRTAKCSRASGNKLSRAAAISLLIPAIQTGNKPAIGKRAQSGNQAV